GITETDEFDIELYEPPVVGITGLSTVCANTPFNLTLTSSIPLTTGTINWVINGENYTRDIATQGMTLSDIVFDNITSSSIPLTVTASVSEPNGCLYNPMATHSMTVTPRPDVYITPGYNFVVCLPDSFSIPLNVELNNDT